MPSAVTEVVQWITSIIAPAAGDPRTAASVRTPVGSLASRTKWLRYFSNFLWGAEQTVSAADTSADTLTVLAHGLAANTAVRLYAVEGGSLPGGLSEDTAYYVDVIDGDTIKLSLTSGPGAAVDLTAGFLGPVYIAAIPDVLSKLLVASGSFGSGALGDLVVYLTGAQDITGAKTITDLTMAGTNKYKLAARGVQRSNRGAWLSGAGVVYLVGGAVDDDDNIKTVLELPNGQTLTEITVVLDPADHTGTGLPGGMPYFQIVKTNMSTLVGVQVGTDAVDSSANATIYSAIHSITKTGLSEVIDNNTYIYNVLFYGETGANKAPIPSLSVPKWTVTATAQDDGAS